MSYVVNTHVDTHDPGFHGLHRIEAELWGGHLRAAARESGRLVGALRRLRRSGLARATVHPRDYVLRAHEILEDALRDQLTGRAVPQSGQGVAATAGGFDATRVEQPTGPDRPIGLLGMSERAVLVGGTCLVESEPGGTSVFVRSFD